MTELDRLPTGAEITAAANERRAKELGLPPASTWTDAELAEFDRLTLRTSSRDQVTRIEARLELKKFIDTHGKPKCDAMFDAIMARDARSSAIRAPKPKARK